MCTASAAGIIPIHLVLSVTSTGRDTNKVAPQRLYTVTCTGTHTLFQRHRRQRRVTYGVRVRWNGDGLVGVEHPRGLRTVVDNDGAPTRGLWGLVHVQVQVKVQVQL
jgi:hypothetical protein